jgi:hypothetical protein
MKSHVLALAALASIGFSGAAYAGEATAVAKGPATMSDADMDRVTAGSPIEGSGLITAASAIKETPAPAQPSSPVDLTPSGVDPGFGKGTAPGQ